jgi:hypothetical protein
MENLFNLYVEYVFGISLRVQELEDVFRLISHNGSPMPAHRALPVN